MWADKFVVVEGYKRVGSNYKNNYRIYQNGPNRSVTKCGVDTPSEPNSEIPTFHASKRPHLGVLVYVSISQNGSILTEIFTPGLGGPPPGTCNILHKNVGALLSGLSCVEKASFRCVSTCIHLPKWLNTHRDMLNIANRIYCDV